MKRKGFTMIEMIVIVAIIGLLAAFGTLRIAGRPEKNALVTFKGKAPEFIRVTAQRAFEEGEDYIIEINTSEETIKRKDAGGTEKEILFLPEILKYEIYGTSVDSITIKVDDRGHGYLDSGGVLSDLNENIFIFNSKDEALYRMKLFSDNPIKYLKVETSLPIGDVDRSNYDANLGDTDTDNWEKE